LLTAVRNHKNYKFNFEKGVMKVGERDFEEDDDLISETDLQNYYIDDLFDDPWGTAEMLFEIYYESNGNDRKFPIFVYKPENEKCDSELVYAEDRWFAEVQLEAYLMCLGKLGKLDFGNGFFYQNRDRREFVVLKHWVYRKER